MNYYYIIQKLGLSDKVCALKKISSMTSYYNRLYYTNTFGGITLKFLKEKKRKGKEKKRKRKKSQTYH